MVKGISKRVILVKSPANTIFEEAIFILKEEALAQDGVDADQILKEACGVAERYVHKSGGRVSKHMISAVSLVAFGASLTGVIWLLSAFL